MSEVFPQDQKFGWSEGLSGTSLSLSRLITSKSLSSKVSSVPQGGLETFRRGGGVVRLQRSEGGEEMVSLKRSERGKEIARSKRSEKGGGGVVCVICVPGRGWSVQRG